MQRLFSHRWKLAKQNVGLLPVVSERDESAEKVQAWVARIIRSTS